MKPVLTPVQRFSLIAALVIVVFFATRNALARGFIIGFSITYVLKYGVFGLRQWDVWFHPERIEPDTKGPYKAFAEPFLRGVWSNT